MFVGGVFAGRVRGRRRDFQPILSLLPQNDVEWMFVCVCCAVACDRCGIPSCGKAAELKCQECGLLCVVCDQVKHSDSRLLQQHTMLYADFLLHGFMVGCW